MEMGFNIEIKARAREWDRQWEMASTLADSGPELIEQADTFFDARHGRLKLREFGTGEAELIPYERVNQAEPVASHYARVSVPDSVGLKAALEVALGIVGVVRKKRYLFLAGQTRIHFDEVEGLGKFIELEAVLKDGQSAAEGEEIVQALMNALGIEPEDLLVDAYIDMLTTCRAREI